MKVLFVCTGNTCRSVLGELCLNKLSAELGLGWQAQSAGTAADPNFPVPQEVRKLARELGFADFHHQARPVSPQLLQWADLVLAMTDSHLRELMTRFPEARAKIQLLKEYAGLGPEDVEDPIRQSEEVYRACLAEIRDAVDRIVRQEAGAKEQRVRESD